MTLYLAKHSTGPVPLAHPPVSSLAPLRRPLRRAQGQRAKLLRRIERALDAGASAKAAGLQRLLLTSHSAKLCSAAKVNRALKSAERARSNELVAIAGHISAFRHTQEEVRVVAGNKRSGGWRPISIFGLKRAALQDMACVALRAFHQPDPRQYAIAGGSHHDAARQICEGLDDGYGWFVSLDITSFYAAIERRSLYDLIPLPGRVIDHVILPPPIEHVRIGYIGRALAGIRLAEASQSGISQGSRSSPLIAEIIVKDILAQFELDVKIVNVADDFGILARSKRDADAIKLALTRASARSPAGCFQLRPKVHSRPRRVCDGFDFVGYGFRRRRSFTLCQASTTNFEKANSRLCQLASAAVAGTPKALTALRQYVLRWWGSFPLMNAHLGQGDYFWARHHTVEVIRRHEQRALPMVRIAMQWDSTGFAALPSEAELTDLSRSIRRRHPKLRSHVPHWRRLSRHDFE